MLDIIAYISCFVTKKHNQQLREPVTQEKQIGVVKFMHRDKILTSNSCLVEFYSGMFDIIGEDIIAIVKESSCKGNILASCYHLVNFLWLW